MVPVGWVVLLRRERAERLAAREKQAGTPEEPAGAGGAGEPGGAGGPDDPQEPESSVPVAAG
jgi:hypothetical protein